MYINEKDLDFISNYINELYPYKENCYIKIFNKVDNKYNFYDINVIKEKDNLNKILNSFDINDLFISMNSFKTKNKATNGNLFSINTLAVDVDYKNKSKFKDLKPYQIIKLLELDYFGQVIPEPNYVEYSNQIRLIYILDEPVFMPKKCKAVKTLINRISEIFANKLKDFGAEIQTPEKFLRVPLTINNKTNDVVYIEQLSDYKYKLSDLQELWLDEIPIWYDNWKNNKKRNKRKFNINNFNLLRINDFLKLQEYLNRMSENDRRRRLCFLYCNYNLLIFKAIYEPRKAEKEAFRKTMEFNNNFNQPLKENKIIGDIKFLRNKQYIYSNKKLISFLELDDYIIERLSFQSIYKVLPKNKSNKLYYEHNKKDILNKKNKSYNSEKAKEKYRNKLSEKGVLSRKEENEILRNKIRNLLEKGFLQIDIAKELNYSYRTIKRHIAFMRKEGLL